MRTLIWFRNDLRIDDQPALFEAVKAGVDGVLAVYVLTPETWGYHEAAAVKIEFILRNLRCLQEALAALNIPLQVHTVPTYQDCAALITQLCQAHQIKAVYVNEQYEIDERQRDQSVMSKLQEFNILWHSFHSDVLVTPGMILSAKNEPIKVFTPFKKKWLAFCHDFIELKTLPVPHKIKHAFAESNSIPKALPHFVSDIPEDLWPAGAHHAHTLLQKFMTQHIDDYAVARDVPGLDATSHLSPYLAQGVLSVRTVLHHLCRHYEVDVMQLSTLQGVGTWLNELIWREFYKHLVFLFPKICCYQSLRSQHHYWPWNEDKTLFAAWCEGRTGFPLIDAAMRQLNQTGWMHNRLRMNVAMFLSKLLMVDWHWGESYFSKHLVDGDLAANNGGWQWCAGVGTDAAPYFRIFNPTTQSENFDPDGAFIRQFCPELSDFDNKAIHAPFEYNPLLAAQVGYPRPIIDYKAARAKALDLLKHFK
jgi:deoxyribodipyrimidine photo-lyase